MNVGRWLHLQTRGVFSATYGDVSLRVKGSRLVTSSALRAQKIEQHVNEGEEWVEIIKLRI